MRVLEFHRPQEPLRLVTRNKPSPGRGCILLRVTTCSVCRTDLHIADGELPALEHAMLTEHGSRYTRRPFQ